jgi:hypothetical protein
MSDSAVTERVRLPNFGLFPFVLLALSIAYYIVFFVVSGIFLYPGLWPLPLPVHESYGYHLTPIDSRVFALVGAGMGALIVGGALGLYIARALHARGTNRSSRPPASTSFAISYDFLSLLCALNIVAVAIFYLLGFRLPVVYQLTHSSLFFALAVVRHGQITRSTSRLVRWIGYGAILFLFLVLAPQQLVTILLLSLAFLGVIEIIHGRRRWIYWAILFGLVLSIYPIKRTHLPDKVVKACWSEADHALPVEKRYFVQTWPNCKTAAERLELIVASASWGRDQVLRRISTILLLDRAVTMTPSRVPYFEGETLRAFIYAPIPRFLRPDKPREDIGNRIGHLYRVLSPDDMTTSINLPWIVEYFINFGAKGIVIGLGLTGFILGGLARLGTSGAHSTIVPLLTIGVLFPLCYQESNISLMVGNALHGAAGAMALIALAWFAHLHRDKSTGLAPRP